MSLPSYLIGFKNQVFKTLFRILVPLKENQKDFKTQVLKQEVNADSGIGKIIVALLIFIIFLQLARGWLFSKKENINFDKNSAEADQALAREIMTLPNQFELPWPKLSRPAKKS